MAKMSAIELAKGMQSKTSALVKNETSPPVIDLINKSKLQFSRVLGDSIPVETFLQVAINSLARNKKLLECDTASLMGALYTSAELGLIPDSPLGHAYLIPYSNKVQFQIGYRGMLVLLREAGYKNIRSEIVYSNDHFECDLGIEQKLVHKLSVGNPQEGRDYPVWIYCIATDQNGNNIFEVADYAKLLEYQKKQPINQGAWSKHEEEMMRKTMIRRIFKRLPLDVNRSLKISKGMESDGSYREIDPMSVPANEWSEVEIVQIDEQIPDDSSAEGAETL